jgi:MFS family permease
MFTNTINRFKGMNRYPMQFWMLIIGSFINSVGSSMIWPFIIIFFRNQLDVSMLQAGSLMTIKSGVSIFSALIAGSLADRFGRKRIMVFSLISAGLIYFLYIPQHPFLVYAVLMALSGLVEPMYRVGATAMVADMLPEESRMGGYALQRMVTNIGLTIGPVLSGILILKSYGLMFSISAICLIVFGLFIYFLINETLVKEPAETEAGMPRENYITVLKNKPFMVFSSSLFLTMTSSVPVFVNLTAYANENYAIPESELGLLLTTNAMMVIVFQFMVTRITEKHDVKRILTIGSIFYAIGTGSIIFGSTLWAFVISMAVMTVGEMIYMPTSTTMAANMAPSHMRGRYMSVYNLAIELAVGVGPMIAGFLNDFMFPKAIWMGCMVLALMAIPGNYAVSYWGRKEL